VRASAARLGECGLGGSSVRRCVTAGLCQYSHGSGYRHALPAIAGADVSAGPCQAADSVNIGKAYRGWCHGGRRTGRHCGWRPGVHPFRCWRGQAGRALRTVFTRECDPCRSRAGRRRGQELALRRGVRGGPRPGRRARPRRGWRRGPRRRRPRRGPRCHGEGGEGRRGRSGRRRRAVHEHTSVQPPPAGLVVSPDVLMQLQLHREPSGAMLLRTHEQGGSPGRGRPTRLARQGVAHALTCSTRSGGTRGLQHKRPSRSKRKQKAAKDQNLTGRERKRDT
jgi:hypothetical protein